MKVFKGFLGVFGIVVILNLARGCSTGKIVAGFDDIRSDIKQIGIIEPCVKLDIFQVKEREFDAGGSDSASFNIKNGLVELLKSTYSISVISIDSSNIRTYDSELISLFNVLNKSTNINLVKLNDRMIKVLPSSADYLLLTYQNGFTRSKNNYQQQLAKGIGLTILTLGLYSQRPVKYSSYMYCAMIDLRQNRVIYYNKIRNQDINPLSKKVTDSQIKYLLRKFIE